VLPRIQPELRRNIIPTSLVLIHGWRANCDVKLLLYNSDPDNPVGEDIAKVTNYIVSYATKGIESVESEKQQLRSIILATEETSGCQKDMIALARCTLGKK
jgi:hypothetical protein